MDDEYDDNLLFCLSQGNWNFAMKQVQMGPEQAIFPNFGYNFCFKKPEDWNHTFQLAANEGFDPLLRTYTDQNGYWFSYSPLMYVRYISNDPGYGLNEAMFTPAYIQYVEARLAWLCAGRLKQKEDLLERLTKLVMRVRAEATSTDSQDLPVGKPPYGTWTLSRQPRISWDLNNDDVPLPGGAQNTQIKPPLFPVIATDDGPSGPVITDDDQYIEVEI